MRMFINRLNQTNYSTNYIRRLMKFLGIKAVIRTPKVMYTRVDPETTSQNILNRDFNATLPNEK